MSDPAKILPFKLKAVVNKQKTRVLFIEVDNKFVDFLLNLLTLPLGQIIKALLRHFGDKAPVIGSLNTLYKGFTELRKVDYSLELRHSLVTAKSGYAFPSGKMAYCSYSVPFNHDSDGTYFWVFEIFPRNTSFIICDDLRIVNNGNGSILETISSVGVDMVDMDGAETRIVTLGINEVMNFLVLLLTSRYPFTDIVLGTTVKSGQESSTVHTKYTVYKSEAGISLQKIEKEAMKLKLILQKSTNKLLFAQADYKFVSLLFSFLEIPLGRVDCPFGNNPFPNSVDTLFRSLTAIASNYLDDENTEDGDFINIGHFWQYKSRMFMVTGDLTVKLLCMLSSISLLDQFKVSLSDVEELELQIGSEEVLSILKASLTSTRAFADGIVDLISKKQRKLKLEK